MVPHVSGSPVVVQPLRLLCRELFQCLAGLEQAALSSVERVRHGLRTLSQASLHGLVIRTSAAARPTRWFRLVSSLRWIVLIRCDYLKFDMVKY